MSSRKLRQPANDAERIALNSWQHAAPVSAMIFLWQSGYTLDRRRDFLANVAGATDPYPCDTWSDDFLAAMNGEFQTDANRP